MCEKITRVLKKYVQKLQACEKSVRKGKVCHKYSIVDVRMRSIIFHTEQRCIRHISTGTKRRTFCACVKESIFVQQSGKIALRLLSGGQGRRQGGGAKWKPKHFLIGI